MLNYFSIKGPIDSVHWRVNSCKEGCLKAGCPIVVSVPSCSIVPITRFCIGQVTKRRPCRGRTALRATSLFPAVGPAVKWHSPTCWPFCISSWQWPADNWLGARYEKTTFNWPMKSITCWTHHHRRNHRVLNFTFRTKKRENGWISSRVILLDRPIFTRN